MKHENGVMTMREVSGFELAPGATLKLQPGGDHLMLIGIKQPLVEGKQITATLKFEKAGETKVVFKIQKPSTPSDVPHGNMPRHKH
jgi:copper(I)-binding protein